jgi:hypothetical protein
MIANNAYVIETFLNRLGNLPLRIHAKLPDSILIVVPTHKDLTTLLSFNLGANITIMHLIWREEYVQLLKNYDVIIFYDNNKLGLLHKNLLFEKLYGPTKNLRVIDLTNITYHNKQDRGVTFWVQQMGHTREDVLELIQKTSQYKPLTNKELQS